MTVVPEHPDVGGGRVTAGSRRSRGRLSTALGAAWETFSVLLVGASVVPLAVAVFTNGVGWVLVSVACNVAGGLVLLSSRWRREGSDT